MKSGMIYMIPTFIADEKTETIPIYILNAIKECKVIVAENERTTRRYLKSLDKSISIDDFVWYTLHNAEDGLIKNVLFHLQNGENVAIISESGCPGIADPGQKIVAAAQEKNIIVKPFVGPSSILLALMASGMNGQRFEFVGYLPINENERAKVIKQLEIDSAKNQSTKIFIETPYRNNQLINHLLQICNSQTKICIATDITGDEELIQTRSVKEWKNKKPELKKIPAIFLLYASN